MEELVEEGDISQFLPAQKTLYQNFKKSRIFKDSQVQVNISKENNNCSYKNNKKDLNRLRVDGTQYNKPSFFESGFLHQNNTINEKNKSNFNEIINPIIESSPTNEEVILERLSISPTTNESIDYDCLNINYDELFLRKDESLLEDENDNDVLVADEEDIIDEKSEDEEDANSGVIYSSYLSKFNTKLGKFTNIWNSPEIFIFNILSALKHLPYITNGFHLWPANFRREELGSDRDWFQGRFDMSLIFLQNSPYDIILDVLNTQNDRYLDVNNRAIFVLPYYENSIWFKKFSLLKYIGFVKFNTNIEFLKGTLKKLIKQAPFKTILLFFGFKRFFFSVNNTKDGDFKIDKRWEKIVLAKRENNQLQKYIKVSVPNELNNLKNFDY